MYGPTIRYNHHCIAAKSKKEPSRIDSVQISDLLVLRTLSAYKTKKDTLLLANTLFITGLRH